MNSVSITEMTLSAIRKVYGKVDGKSIAKQLGMTSNENATPIKVNILISVNPYPIILIIHDTLFLPPSYLF